MINYECMRTKSLYFITTPRTAALLHSTPVSITQCDNCGDEDRDKRYFLLKVKSVLFHIPWISCWRIPWNMGKKASSNDVTAFESAVQTILKQRKTPKCFILAHLLESTAIHTCIFSCLSYNVKKKFSSGSIHVIPIVWNYRVNQNVEKYAALFQCNSLKMKCVCFIQELKVYRAVNPMHFSYKKTNLLVTY